MRAIVDGYLENHRHESAAHLRGKMRGAFIFPDRGLKIIAHDGNEMDYFREGVSGPLWEHVSVSRINCERLPTWEEMCWVKSLFWEPEETVIQFHPAKSEYVNDNPHVLHLWRLVGENHPLPPRQLV